MRIYLDHNATAPLRPEAREAMVAALEAPGNASSAHREGARARGAVEAARAEVAALVGARPAEIVFTSGATEANNLALRGAAAARPGTTLVVPAIEHASVLDTARATGVPLRIVRVDGEGRVDAAAVARACEVTGPVVASVGLANGEVGSVAPVAEVARLLAGRDAWLHSDAAQAPGRLAVDVGALGVDLLTLASHKLGGPIGVGALWIGPRAAVVAQATGGPQERGRRAGTENVAAIVGFGAAARVVRERLAVETAHAAALVERLWDGIRRLVPGAARNGPAGPPRLPNTLNVGFPGCVGESLMVLLDLAGIAVSVGSACAAGAAEPSHVLVAMGRDPDAARSALRLSVGPTTTADEIDRVLAVLPPLVTQVRGGRAA